MSKENNLEQLAYEQIGRIVVAELNTNKPFKKEFNRMSIGDKVNRIAQNYLIEEQLHEREEQKRKKSFWKRLFSWMIKDHDLHQKHAL